MADWVRCQHSNGTIIYINRDNITMIEQRPNQSVVYFVGDRDNRIGVVNPPHIIMGTDK